MSTHWHQGCCAQECARAQSNPVQRQPTATKCVRKNRPEIRYFRDDYEFAPTFQTELVWLGRRATDAPAAHYADSRLRGRPPLAPLALAAAVFAFDRRRPPRCPVARANKRVPNARSTSPGTYTSTSSDGQDKASPAGETLIDLSADAGTSSRPETICRGIAIDPPLRNLRSIVSRVASYRASTTPEGSSARACPRARARVKRSRSFAVRLAAVMEFLRFQFQELCI